MDIVDKRFMFDTSALNRISHDPGDEILIYRSKSFGFEYYFSEIQVDEILKSVYRRNADVPDDLVERDRVDFMSRLLKIVIKLQTQYVGQIATLRPNRWILDGTFDILPDNENTAMNVFEDILNGNDRQHYNDAMIGMVAISHGCTLIVNDRRFFNKVNRGETGRAITYEDFIARISAACSDASRSRV